MSVRIHWRQGMSVDQGPIDEDHRHLIDLINRFTDHVPGSPSPLAEALDVLHALEFYADAHFAREEQLQRLVAFPESAAHQEEHRRLRATLEQILARAKSPRTAEPAAIVQDLGQLLKRWLMDHIIKHDLQMKPYAHLMKRYAAGLPELGDVRPGVAAPSGEAPGGAGAA
jgi:hemerythrin